MEQTQNLQTRFTNDSSKNLLKILWLIFISSASVGCSPEDAKVTDESTPQKNVQVTADEGLTLKEHTSMQQSVDGLRELQKPAESTPLHLTSDDDNLSMTAPVEADAPPSAGGADGDKLKFEEHLRPQTSAMRLEARNAAMIEMLRVKKDITQGNPQPYPQKK